MAKDRPQKLVKEESSKKEKKVSEDKVKKAKKEKKPKSLESLVTLKEADSDSDSSGGAPVLGKEITKKPTKKERAGKKQNKEEIIRAQIEESKSSEESDSGSSSASSSDSEDSEAPAVKVPSTKAPRAAVTIEPNSLFTIDTNPTPINRKATAPSESSRSTSSESSSDEDETKGSKPAKPQAKADGVTTLNRSQRRRLQLIGRQREVIRKSLDIPPGSNERAEELEAALAAWTTKYDDKAAIRMEKKAKRKEKDAMKLRNKRGKLLKGRRLRERTKQITKMEKKAAKKGMRKESAF